MSFVGPAGRRWFVLGLAAILIAVSARFFWPRPSVSSLLDAPLTLVTPVVIEPVVAPYQPPTVADDRLTVFVDRRNDLDERLSPDLIERLRTVVFPDDQAAVVTVLEDPEDDDTVRHEAAELLRRSGYGSLTDCLIGLLASPAERPRFRSWSVQHLGLNLEHADGAERARILDALRQAVHHPEIETRREALFALANAGDATGAQVAIAWLSDPSPAADATRAIAIRCVQEVLDRRDQLPVVRRYARAADEEIRIAALVALSQWHDAESLEAFAEAAADGSARLRRCGTAALARMAALEQPVTP